MSENARVAAFGRIKGIVHSLRRKDVVFVFHKGYGIVAAGRVGSETVKADSKWLNSNKGTKCDIEICDSRALFRFREFKCAASEFWTPPASLPLGLPAGQLP
jgi:hypothetical protein